MEAIDICELPKWNIYISVNYLNEIDPSLCIIEMEYIHICVLKKWNLYIYGYYRNGIHTLMCITEIESVTLLSLIETYMRCTWDSLNSFMDKHSKSSMLKSGDKIKLAIKD